jgi:flagellar biosynthesis/type III secretory pathway protein FliH
MMNWSSSLSGGADSPSPVNSRDAIAWAPDELALYGGAHAPLNHASAPDDALVPARLVEDARQGAFEEGFRAGEDSERARLFQVARALQDGVSSVQNGVDRWISNAEENIAALAVAIARHILSREVAVDREATLGVVQQAIAEFSIDHPVTVRLHPADHAVIVPMLLPGEGDPGRRSAEWIADARVAPGGCVVEGRERIIDGRVDAALERVYRRLTYTGA